MEATWTDEMVAQIAAPCGFIEREMLALREAASRIGWGDDVSVEMIGRRDELMAAQQALAWALDPTQARSPYSMITGGTLDSLHVQKTAIQ